ncbi:hypothetical protein JVT61DRAFT_14229 [Boletus reticuloceps]|uniref:Uncharacterized protein n=1 Tax=Boletus reticuloceps TaxID=495285 RepID=A0A8I3A2N3_9AGAM|nr:hypothetical protein JVT61DRAFT_14229 [Boletus reticuloceps]
MVYIQSLGSFNRYRINQAIPSELTTSFDYQWPYDATEDTPTSAPLLTGTSDADSDEVASFQNVALSTNPATASLIQVTALPPAKTLSQAVLPKLPYHRQLNVLYLIPLFIALGVVLGAITAAIFLKWRENRWRLLRTSTLLPGPPYAPPENDVEGRLLVHGYPSMEQVSLFAAATPSKFTIHGSRYVPKRTFAWQTLDATQPPYSRSTYTQTIIPSSDGERFTVVTEEDPFLSTSPMVMRRSPKSQNDVSPLQTRVSPSLPDPTPGDDPDRPEAEHTGLPKPFRRSMFDILKLKGPYRSVPTRQQYSVLTPDEDPADKTPDNQVRRVVSFKTTVAGERRSRSSRRSLDGDFHVGDMEDALGLLGSAVLPKQTLRLKEGTLSSPTQGEKMEKSRKVTPSTLESKGSRGEVVRSEDESINSRSGDEIEEEKRSDIYTKAPQRRHSRTPHKRVLSNGSSRWSSAPDTHASVLPLSPPLLMSPPLEKSLFFTSSLSSSASLAKRMNALATTHPSHPHHVDHSPELSLFPLPSKKKRESKKLRTKRPEPPLPYPSYPGHDPSQPTPSERSASADIKHGSVSPGSPQPKGLPTSAAHRESTMGIWSLGSLSPSSFAIALASSSSADVLDKVNDIVALGYTKKRTSIGGADDNVASLADSV